MEECKVSINFLRLKDIFQTVEFNSRRNPDVIRIERTEKKKKICKFERFEATEEAVKAVAPISNEPAEAILICHWLPDQIFLARPLLAPRLCTRRSLR